jgi:para-nitrobenzyl esterase
MGGCGGGGGGKKEPEPGPGPDPDPIAADQAETVQGTIQGAIEGSLVVFRGVRYAAPPVDDLRFKAPAPPAAFAGVRDALDFGAKCIQAQGIGATTGEEDCLFMNIWSHNDDVVRPVMVNLHPGGSNGVSGDISSIEPSEFAVAADVVVVNMNRRLSVMGSLAIDELVQENPRLTAGNYGLLDVIAALEWVRDNIAAFNGDPTRVMLFGTSAGGMATCLLLGSPDVNGLIHAASMQSAPCTGNLQVLTATSPYDSRFPPAVDTHREILTATGCDVAADILACLRGLTAEELVLAGDAQNVAANRPIYSYLVDGVIVQAGPYDAVENQIAGDIPLIVGMAKNEVGTRFDGLSLPDDAAYRAQIEAVFPDPIDDGLYAIYPSASYPTPLDAWKTLFGDVVFSCRAELIALNAASGAPSYLYEITRGFDPALGATHSIDSPYLFGTFDVFGYTPDPEALLISMSMRSAWSSLAHDPTMPPTLLEGAGMTWPVYDSAVATYVDFGDPLFAGPGHRGGRCAAVRSVFN